MDQNNQNQSFSLNRDNNNSQTFSLGDNSSPMQQMQSQTPVQTSTPSQAPIMAFPANQKRATDPNIFNMVFDLVERKYRPNFFIPRYQQLSAQDPQTYPALDQNMITYLQSQGPDITEEQRDFEVARVYNKLEIDIYMMSTSQLSPEKQEELKKMTDDAQNNPSGFNQNELNAKIQKFMADNVPSISEMIKDYLNGFTNEYLAGHY